MGFFSKLIGVEDGDAVSPDGAKGYAGKTCSQQEFDRKNLAGMSFAGADLSQCGFEGAILTNADFTGAKISQCNFTGADLRGARLDRADVSQCEFTHAKLDGLSTTDTEFTQCDDMPADFYSKFDDIPEDDDKFRIARQRLERLAHFYPGGSVKERRDDDKLFFAGTFNGLPFRMLIETTWGTPTLEVKAPISEDAFELTFDPEVQVEPAPEQDAVWDQDDAPTMKAFLGPGVYFEGNADDIARMKQKLPGELHQATAQFMRAQNIKTMSAEQGELTLEYRGDVLKGDLAGRTQAGLDVLAHLATRIR